MFANEYTPCGGRNLDAITYSPMTQYTSKKSSMEGTLSCMIAGAMVFWVILTLMQSTGSKQAYYLPSNVLQASAKLAVSARRTISARVATVPKHLLSLKECKAWLKVSDSLIDGANDAIVVADCKGGDYKSMKDTERTSIDKGLREYLKTESKMAIMIFAPWCPHCHTMMPEFLKIAAESRKQGSKCKFLLINAESVKRDSLTKGHPTCIYPLEYFPTFLVKEGDKYTENTLPSLVAFCGGGEKKVGDVVAETTTEEEKGDDDDFMARLF